MRNAVCAALAAVLLMVVPDGPRAAADSLTILRDAYGVPHLFTDGKDALERGAYADGWAQGEDRLFQMDILRRAATGRLSENLGSDYLVMDQVARRDGYTLAERDALFNRLSARDRRVLEAYRDGLNAFIDVVTADTARLPAEFFGVPPVHWEVTDSVAIAGLEFDVFGASGGREVLNADLLLDLLDRHPEAEAKGVFDDLFWIDDPAAPTTIRDRSVRDPDAVRRFAPAQLDFVRSQAASIRRAAAALRAEQGLLAGLGRGLGVPARVPHHASNAIVIGKALSATGGTLLLGGPQTGLTIPSFFWEVGLHGGGYEAEGVIAPAGPGVLIGRGRNFAMSITSGIMDNVDTYVEHLDPADPERYLFRGRSRPFGKRTETFAVAGQPDVSLVVRTTVHGPVFFYDREAGLAYSRRAAFRGRELDSASALIGIGFVRNLGQFRKLADRVAVSLNLHYADAAGNIAYFHRGVRPLRPLHTDPRLPLDGAGTMEWRGLVPPRRMPSVVNPRQGFITNWNNKPIAGWSTGEQQELWGIVDRVQVFIDALDATRAAQRKLTLDDVQALMQHAATSDIFAARILPFLAAAVGPGGDPALVEAVGRVRTWVDAGAPLIGVPDRDGVIPDPGAAIYTEFRTVAQTAVLGPELGGALRPMDYPAVNDGNQEDDHGSFGSPDALFLRVLFSAGAVAGAPAPAGLLSVSRDYFTAAGAAGTRAAALTGALQTALTNLATRFGTADQSQWQMPALRASYMPQGAFVPPVIARENRGTFNLLADWGSDRHEIIVPPGESGTLTAADIGHEPPHIQDQLPLYESFSYRTQPFTRDQLAAPVTEETIPFTPSRRRR